MCDMSLSGEIGGDKEQVQREVDLLQEDEYLK
jgi:hypothetical protein